MIKKLCWMLLVLVLFLSGCDTPRPAATPASAPAAPVTTAPATRAPTLIPTAPAAPTATTAPTETPMETPTPTVSAQVEAAYLAATAALYHDHTLDEVLNTFTAADFARYLGDIEASHWLAAQQSYRETGQLPLAYVIYEQEHTLKVRNCTTDTCYLEDTKGTISVRVPQADGTWRVVTVDEDPQYASVGDQTVRMEYSAEYGWRIAEYVSWVPAN